MRFILVAFIYAFEFEFVEPIELHMSASLQPPEDGGIVYLYTSI